MREKIEGEKSLKARRTEKRKGNREEKKEKTEKTKSWEIRVE